MSSKPSKDTAQGSPTKSSSRALSPKPSPKQQATETTALLPKNSKRGVHINTSANRSKSPVPEIDHGTPLFYTDYDFDSDAEIEAVAPRQPRKSFQERYCNKRTLFLTAGLIVSVFRTRSLSLCVFVIDLLFCAVATANNLMFKR